MNAGWPTITSVKTYSDTLAKIAEQAEKMVKQVIGTPMPMDVITIFSASDDEHIFIKDYLLSIGKKSRLSHGLTTYVSPKTVNEIHGYRIKLLGVRAPDTTRHERGYVDLPVENYSKVKTKLDSNSFVHEVVSGRGRNMLEIRHPDFDVRAYIVSTKDHL